MKIVIGSGIILFIIGIAIYAYWLFLVPPACSDRPTTNLVKKILVEQFKYPVSIKIDNVRTSQGSLFGNRFECDASIEGDLSAQTFLGVEMHAVHYTSEITEDTHRQFVTAQLRP